MQSNIPCGTPLPPSEFNGIQACGNCCENNFTYLATPLCLQPEITSPLSLIVGTGTPFTYTITARNSIIDISASSVPSFLTYDGNITLTGTIPNEAGVYTFNVQAVNLCGTDFQTVTLTAS
jgi:hypothetical protein